jgi:cysteine synthase B
VCSSDLIPGIRKWPEAYLPKIFERSRVDRVLEVSAQDAEDTTRSLAHEGVFVGTSSGGAVWAARQLCRELAQQRQPAVIACILCDRGDRYLSSPLFDSPT